MWAKADGKAKYTSNSVEGNRFSYGDLDLDSDRLGIPVFDFYFGTSVHQLHLEYLQFDLSGSDSINKNLTIDSQPYLFNDVLSTDLQTTWGKLYYEFFDVRQNYSYGVLLGVERYTFQYDILDNASKTHQEFEMTTINPLLGTHIMMGQGTYALKATAFYIPKLFGIIDYDTLDLSIAAVFSFGNYMQIEGGYRFVKTTVDGSDKEDFNQLKLKGLFATIRIHY